MAARKSACALSLLFRRSVPKPSDAAGVLEATTPQQISTAQPSLASDLAECPLFRAMLSPIHANSCHSLSRLELACPLSTNSSRELASHDACLGPIPSVVLSTSKLCFLAPLRGTAGALSLPRRPSLPFEILPAWSPPCRQQGQSFVHTFSPSSSPARRFSQEHGQEQGRQPPGLSSEAQRQHQRQRQQPQQEKGLASQEDVFDTITDRIPERPVTAAEGVSYSFVILAGLGLAGGALYFVLRELVLEPKELRVFGRALARVQKDAQVVSYLGSPITGYGQESRNRAARQRISHKVWKDEDGVKKTMVQFHIRGPGGAGLVHCEMFEDPEENNKLKYTYLVVDITNPVPRRLMLESYVPKSPL